VQRGGKRQIRSPGYAGISHRLPDHAHSTRLTPPCCYFARYDRIFMLFPPNKLTVFAV
jgi:hypothetical protein